MEILQLKYFRHAAESENFSRTAEHYKVPTSNISRAVRCLEGELGVKLFDRSSNKLKLNEKGRVFLEHIKLGLSELEAGRNAVCEKNDHPKGELRLLLSSCRRIATKAIELFQKKYPDVSFNVKHGLSDDDFDVIISDAPPVKGNYDTVKLTTERVMLAVPDTYPFDTEHSESCLRDARFISLGDGTRLHELTLQICRTMGFSPNIAIMTDDPYYMRKYLEMGLGVAFFPEKSWAQLIPEGVRLIDVGLPERNIFMFTPKTGDKTAAQKIFMDTVINCFAGEER